jgi:hypothetical protein
MTTAAVTFTGIFCFVYVTSGVLACNNEGPWNCDFKYAKSKEQLCSWKCGKPDNDGNTSKCSLVNKSSADQVLALGNTGYIDSNRACSTKNEQHCFSLAYKFTGSVDTIGTVGIAMQNSTFNQGILPYSDEWASFQMNVKTKNNFQIQISAQGNKPYISASGQLLIMNVSYSKNRCSKPLTTITLTASTPSSTVSWNEDSTGSPTGDTTSTTIHSGSLQPQPRPSTPGLSPAKIAAIVGASIAFVATFVVIAVIIVYIQHHYNDGSGGGGGGGQSSSHSYSNNRNNLASLTASSASYSSISSSWRGENLPLLLAGGYSTSLGSMDRFSPAASTSSRSASPSPSASSLPLSGLGRYGSATLNPALHAPLEDDYSHLHEPRMKGRGGVKGSANTNSHIRI